MDKIETKGLGISELLDKIMEEEEKKAKKRKKKKKKKNDSGKNLSNHLKPVSGSTDIENYSYNPQDINSISNISSSSSRHLVPPALSGVAPQIHTNFPHEMHSMPAGNINPFQNYNPPIQPIQPVECYGKHCAAVFEPPKPIQNFPLNQHYSEHNTNASFSAPAKPSNNCSNSFNNKESKGKDKKKKRKISNPNTTFTPTLKPPPSPPNFLKLPQRTASPHRPYTPPLRPFTPLEPPLPFISEEMPFKQDQLQAAPSYVNSYPRSPPPLNSHNCLIISTPSRPPEPPEPPPLSPGRDFSEDLRTTLNALRERKRKRSFDENRDDSWRSNSKETNENRYKNEKFSHQSNNNNNNSRENNIGSHRSSERYNKFSNGKNAEPPFAPLGIRFPSQNEIVPSTAIAIDRITSFNCNPEPFNEKHGSHFPVVEGMPFPPPGVVFNKNVNIGPGSGPPPFMDASGLFNSTERQLPPPPPPPPPPPSLPPPPPPPPLNCTENQSYNLMEKKSISDVCNELLISDEYNIHEKQTRDRKSSRDSKNHKRRSSKKSSTRKKKPHNYSDTPKSRHRGKKPYSKTKHTKLSKHEKEKLRKKMKKYPDYELEPGECISDSDLELESISEESESETSSTSSSYTSSSSSSSSSFSTSSDTEDSLYKLEFLKKRKPRISRYDKLCDKVSDEEESKINSEVNEEKPKFPRYFKDKVAYADEISVTPQEEQVIAPEEVPPPIVEDSVISKEEIVRPPSPPVSCESQKALRTPLIKRLGFTENRQEMHGRDEWSDVENNKEMDEYPSYTNMSHTEDNLATKPANRGSPLYSFEEYRQRSNSLSPNNSLDFEEYKLLVSTKEILSASKSIFKSPTSPKATTTKKYEKPIIKVESVSKPSPYTSKPSPYMSSIIESPQRIDLDSRIRLMFGMKSCGDDNSPEKKNFRNAAFSCKNMRLLSRPPSPFRSKNAYKYWHRETYYFRKNNPIPDVFFDPTQKTIISSDHTQQTTGVDPKLSEFLKDTIRFSSIKPDYYQSVKTGNEGEESDSVEAFLAQNSEETKQKVVEEPAILDAEKVNQKTLEIEEEVISSGDLGKGEALETSCGTSHADYIYENKVTTTKQSLEEHEEIIVSSSSNKHILKLRDSVMKVDVQSDTEVELVSKEEPPEEDKQIRYSRQQEAVDTNPSSVDSSGYMIQLILGRIVDELKNEIKERLIAERLADENLHLEYSGCDQSDSFDVTPQRQKTKEVYHESKMDRSGGGKSVSSVVDQLQSNVINESGQS